MSFDIYITTAYVKTDMCIKLNRMIEDVIEYFPFVLRCGCTKIFWWYGA